MKAASLRPDEAATLAVLHELAILDSAPDVEIDALAAVAAAICGAPIALVSLIDADRQWFKANVGLTGIEETARELAFCAHAVLGEDVFTVEDARLDDRFADNPLVTGHPDIRFYAGAPVTLEGRHRVGTVCVIDQTPRRLTPLQQGALENLAIAAGRAIEARASARKLRLHMDALAERERDLRLVIDAVPSAMAYWDADLRCRFANTAHGRWFGRAPDSLVGAHLRDTLGPDLFASQRPFVERALAGERLEFERILNCADGVPRDVLAHYVPDVVDGRVVGFLVQATDVTPLKAAAQALTREKAEMQRVIELQDRTAGVLNDAQRLGRIGSWRVDLDGRRSTWSDEMYRISGRDRLLPPPSLEERLEVFVPESRERLRSAAARCKESGVAYVLELEFVRPADGELRCVETRGTAVRDAQGRIAGLQGTMQDITEQKRLTRALAQQHELSRVALLQLRHVTNSLPALISYLDGQERFRFANRLYADWLGHDPQALVGTSLLELYGQAAYDGFKAHVRQALAGERVSYTRELATRVGRRHVEVSLVPDVDESGRVEGVFAMMIDATARRDAEAALQRSERRLRMVADNLPALVTYVDADERYRFVNDCHGSVFYIEPDRLLGRGMRETAGETLYAEIAPHVAAALRGEQTTFQGVVLVRGQPYHHQSTYVPDIDDAGTVRGFYAMTFDITALKETQRRLDELARVDALTALPNRRQFDERLPEAMARTRRAGRPMALLFLDIDRFKHINDTLGHGGGDVVLKEFAVRLKRQVRGTDLVVRFAGDEFVILLEGIRSVDELENVAAKIVGAIRPPFALGDGSVVEVTTSVGAALYDGGDQPAADLLAAADRALYKAKRDGRDGYALASDGTTLAGLLAADAPAGGGLAARAAQAT